MVGAVASPVRSSLDLVQVDAVAGEVAASGQHQRLQAAPARALQGDLQATALAFAHGAVVEVPLQPARTRTGRADIAQAHPSHSSSGRDRGTGRPGAAAQALNTLEIITRPAVALAARALKTPAPTRRPPRPPG